MSNSYVKGIAKSKHEREITRNSTLYAFSNDVDDEEDGGDYELKQLRPRRDGRPKKADYGSDRTPHSADPFASGQFVEKTILDGETLPSLAIKYSCPVGTLKALNNLVTDQDFYRLQTLKVPVKEHSVLREIVERDERDATRSKVSRTAARRHNSETRHRQGSDSARVSVGDDAHTTDLDFDASDPETQQLIVRTLSIKDNCADQGHEASVFLQRMDTDIHKIVQSTNSRMRSLEEVASHLTAPRIQPLRKRDANWGLSWRCLLGWIVIIAVLLPLFFLFYRYLQT